jgi:hypothetical protein
MMIAELVCVISSYGELTAGYARHLCGNLDRVKSYRIASSGYVHCDDLIAERELNRSSQYLNLEACIWDGLKGWAAFAV